MNAVAQPTVLVTNDDGFDSEGLRLLAVAAAESGLVPLVVAPATESSGSSAALPPVSADTRIPLERRKLADLPHVPAFAVQAGPAFVAFVAARGAFGIQPTMVLSGINHGPNTGRAVLHSGTVGVAMTAATAGIRAAAFSLDVRDAADRPRWQTAATVAAQIIPTLDGIAPGTLLNVNVPNVPLEELRGIRSAVLADSGAVQLTAVDAGADYLQVTMSEQVDTPAPGSDAALLASNHVTVTALRPVCEESTSWL